jgi:hypothetical protein
MAILDRGLQTAGRSPGSGTPGRLSRADGVSARGLTVFVYGFAKNERDNIGPEELDFWRQVARAFVTMDEARLQTLLAEREIMEVIGDG